MPFYYTNSGGQTVTAATGTSGTPGASTGTGGGDLHYVHTQGVAAATWHIAHNLGKFPSITVTDSGGTVGLGDTQHTDVNNAVLTFAFPFSGTALCN